MDQGHIAHGLEDAPHVVVNREHETRRKLPQRRSGVHQRWRVWQEFQPRHEGEILFLGLCRVSSKRCFNGGHRLGHTAEHLERRLRQFPVLVAEEVAPLQHFDCVDGELEIVTHAYQGLDAAYLGVLLPV